MILVHNILYHNCQTLFDFADKDLNFSEIRGQKETVTYIFLISRRSLDNKWINLFEIATTSWLGLILMVKTWTL